MYRRPPPGPVGRWMRRWLYRLTVIIAAGLGGLVMATPHWNVTPGPDWLDRAAWLFAHDDLLRKVSVISAVGLWLTAIIFFRPRGYEYNGWEREPLVPLE